jgi:hypothetical protein
MPIDEQTIAEDRVRRYLDIRDRVKMLNLSDVVHAVHSGTEHEAELRLSGVRALLTAASNEARLQREVEALRARDAGWCLRADEQDEEIKRLRIALRGLLDDHKDAWFSTHGGNADFYRRSAVIDAQAALTPPAASEEDAK